MLEVDHGFEHAVFVGGGEIEGGFRLCERKAVGHHHTDVKVAASHHIECWLYTVTLTAHVLDADLLVAQFINQEGNAVRGRRDADQ